MPTGPGSRRAHVLADIVVVEPDDRPAGDIRRDTAIICKSTHPAVRRSDVRDVEVELVVPRFAHAVLDVMWAEKVPPLLIGRVPLQVVAMSGGGDERPTVRSTPHREPRRAPF